MVSYDTVVMTLVAAFCGWQWYAWRQTAMKMQEFIENPNNTPVSQESKEKAYKDSYEAMLNALSDERRQQKDAMMEVFDFLNDNRPFGSHQEGLAQCRNILLRAIQNSTWQP